MLGDIYGLYSETHQKLDAYYTYDAWGLPTLHKDPDLCSREEKRINVRFMYLFDQVCFKIFWDGSARSNMHLYAGSSKKLTAEAIPNEKMFNDLPVGWSVNYGDDNLNFFERTSAKNEITICYY